MMGVFLHSNLFNFEVLAYDHTTEHGWETTPDIRV